MKISEIKNKLIEAAKFIDEKKVEQELLFRELIDRCKHTRTVYAILPSRSKIYFCPCCFGIYEDNDFSPQTGSEEKRVLPWKKAKRISPNKFWKRIGYFENKYGR